MLLYRPRRRLSQRFSASSSAPEAIPEDGNEGEVPAEGLGDAGGSQELPRSPPQVFHCSTCGIDTTSAAHLEVSACLWSLVFNAALCMRLRP